MKRAFTAGLVWLSIGWLFAIHPSYDSSLDSLRVPAPIFDYPHGFYDTGFLLTITSSTEGGKIRYTLDGSDPTANHGDLYESPLFIKGTTIVRACVIPADPSLPNSRITTRSYLFIEDILQQSHSPDYPDTWGPYATRNGYAKADYEMDPEIISQPGMAECIRNGLLSLPVVSIATDKNNLFNPENDPVTGGIYMYTDPPTGYTKTKVNDPGTKWMRPASVEVFDTTGLLSFQVDCGLRLHGGHSRLPEKSPKHSFRLAFKSEYGPKKLKHNLFGDGQAKKIDNIVLRGGFCNTWIHANGAEREKAVYVRDTWAKTTQALMGHPASRFIYAHLFINGLYWGVYNPTERIDNKWCEAYFGGSEEDYDVIKVEDNPQTVLAGDGSMEAWNELFDLASQSNQRAIYQQIQGRNLDGSRNEHYPALLDMVNFVDYMIINIYGGNTDWDRHNWLAVRNRVNPDQGFKMLCWDSEHVLKDVNQDVKYGELRAGCPSVLFGQLMKQPDFVRLVGDRIQKHCFEGGVLSPEQVALIWKGLSVQIDQAIYAESARWGDYRRDVHAWQYGPYELYTKENHYDAAHKKVVENILPFRRDVFVAQMRKLGLFPNVEAAWFRINGERPSVDSVQAGDWVSLHASKGKIYYTTDGSDPVLWQDNGKGRLSDQAVEYQAAFELDCDSLHIATRVFDNQQWSALSSLAISSPSHSQDESDKPQPNDLSSPESLEPILRYVVTNDQLCLLDCSFPSTGQLRLQVYDVYGRCLLSSQHYLHDPHQVVPIELSSLTSGWYVIRAQFDGPRHHSSHTLQIIYP